MSKNNTNTTGNIARHMAAAPIEHKATPATPATPENPVAAIFGQPIFTLPKNRTPFPPNDDGSVTTKLANVLLPFASVPSLKMRASIYQTERTVTDATGTYRSVEVYLSLPSSGKGFPVPVITPDDGADETVNHLDAWRYSIAEQYDRWYASLKRPTTAIGRAPGAARLVKRLPAS